MLPAIIFLLFLALEMLLELLMSLFIGIAKYGTKIKIQEKYVNSNLIIENIDLEYSEEVIEDDTVLIEEDADIDPAIDVGIKPKEDKE